MTAQPPDGQPGTILGPQPCPQADPASGRCTIGLAALFEPGIVADISVKLRQMEPAP